VTGGHVRLSVSLGHIEGINADFNRARFDRMTWPFRIVPRRPDGPTRAMVYAIGQSLFN